jgi:crotonobetainyl-CoA:carnitine CoA-transferase CaiB-like acyl-CoA transferase
MLENILRGYRIVDLTQNVAGPFCTQILGDLGAEIIKVERPKTGDDTRAWQPPEIGGKSSTFLALNRNKKSVCIDLDSTDGRDVLRKLSASADVVIHSLRPGSAESRGIGYDDLKQEKPDLIYCAISAFGDVGPLREMPGYDPLMQAFSGIMSVTGNPDDDPVRVSVSLIDMGTGMWAALGIVGALLHRSRTGEGMEVRASLLDTGLSWMSVFIASYLASGKLPQKMGSAMAMTAPYELFKTSDGNVFIAAGNDRLFTKVCEALGCPELATDERFVTNGRRVTQRALLHDLLAQRSVTMTTAGAVEALRKAGAPCSELNDLSQALSHEQVRASEMIADLPVEGAPQHKVVALPLSADGRRSRVKVAPPALGAHTDDVLAEYGYTSLEIADLKRRAVIA